MANERAPETKPLSAPELLDPTNEWEVLRYRLAGKTGIVYRNAKGRANPSGAAGTHYHNLIAGRPLEMSSGDAKRIARATSEHRRTLTLYSDASSYHTTGAASWGAILVDADGTEHEASGPLKGEVSSSTAAEARAVANALHHFMREGLITGDVRVVCDNQAVVDKLRSGSLKTKSPQMREALEHIRKISRGRFTVLADWVKGHQPKAKAKSDPAWASITDAMPWRRPIRKTSTRSGKRPRERVPMWRGWRWPMPPRLESVSHGKPGLATNGCVVPKRRAGPPMTGNPAQARELKPHTQNELNP